MRYTELQRRPHNPESNRFRGCAFIASANASLTKRRFRGIILLKREALGSLIEASSDEIFGSLETYEINRPHLKENL